MLIKKTQPINKNPEPPQLPPILEAYGRPQCKGRRQ